ncbi:MAG: thioredoxin family protein [Saprospiraceae bacterium]|nr:thioredoxin family protein [Lewinella sp.]
MRFIALLITMFCLQAGHSQEWLTDMDQAAQTASQEHRNIILVFQGSDWCAPCIKLEKEIWDSPEFQEYAAEHYVLLKADFPRRKKNQLPAAQQKHNDRLAGKYNQEGFFPLVLVLTPDGKVLGKTGYEHLSPEEYIQLLQSFEAS